MSWIRFGRRLGGVALLALPACMEGDSLLFSAAATMERVSPLEQTGEVGLPTPERPAVRVRDERGNPVPGAAVFFRVVDGEGTVDRELAFTDPLGVASVLWTLGEDTGRNEVIAESADPALSDLGFTATSVAGPPAQLTSWLPNLLAGPAGTALPIPLVVVVRDRFSNPVPGVGVAFTLVGSAGSLQNATATSNQNGVASAGSWTLGPVAGTQSADAVAAGVEALRVNATAFPGAAHSATLEATPPATAVVDELLLNPVVVEIVDQLGNAIAGLPVQLRVTGGGAIHPSSGATDSEGRFTLQSWRIGRTVGEQEVQIEVPGLAPLEFRATALAGPAERVSLVQGHGQAGAPGTALPDPLSVRVADRFGNPVPDRPVAFVVTAGGGSVEVTEATSDSDGVATAGSWELGGTLGVQSVAATLPGTEVNPFAFEAEAVSGMPLEIVPLEGAGQAYAAGYPLPESVVVRVQDSGGTPAVGVEVFFQVLGGGGAVTPGSAVTDAEGTASLSEWRLGPEVGPNLLLVRARGGAAISVEAEGEAPYLVSVGEVHLNQGNQSAAGNAPAVAGRPGVLRVFPVATLANADAPAARIRLFHGTVEVLTQVVPLSSTGVPTAANPAGLTGSYHLPLPGALIQPGLGIVVELDPTAEDLDVPDRAPLVFPSDGGTHPLAVEVLPPMAITFVPIHSTVMGTTGRVDASNVEAFLGATRRMLPVAQVDAAVHPGYTTSARPLTGTSAGVGWGFIAIELLALRTAEGSSRYYHGILQKSVTDGPTGIAYRTGDPDDDRRVAVSWDQLPEASSTVAHEFGHNFGQRHAPCGAPEGVEPTYPTPGAALTTPGWDASTETFLSGDHFDLMSYCFPKWVSDFTYGRILAFRIAGTGAAPSALDAARGPGTGVLLWGEWSAGRALLNPVFHLTSVPTRVPTRPNGEVTGFDRAGGLLFRVPVAGAPLADGTDPDLRQFAAFVPIDATDRARLHRVLLRTPFGEVERIVGAESAATAGTTGDAPAGALPAPRSTEARVSTGTTPGRLAVEWDATAYPVALIRDASTGRILSFARDGRVEVPTPPSGSLDLQFGEGVRIQREQIRFR